MLVSHSQSACKQPQQEQWEKPVLLSVLVFVWLSTCNVQRDSFHTLPCILILPSSGQDFPQAPAAACVELQSLKEPVELSLAKSAPELHVLLQWEPFFTLLLP